METVRGCDTCLRSTNGMICNYVGKQVLWHYREGAAQARGVVSTQDPLMQNVGEVMRENPDLEALLTEGYCRDSYVEDPAKLAAMAAADAVAA